MADNNSYCSFCNGDAIAAEEISGNGTINMTMALDTLFNRFCENHENPKECENGIQLMDGNKLFFDNSGGEYRLLGIEINYCPFCGKELIVHDQSKSELS